MRKTYNADVRLCVATEDNVTTKWARPGRGQRLGNHQDNLSSVVEQSEDRDGPPGALHGLLRWRLSLGQPDTAKANAQASPPPPRCMCKVQTRHSSAVENVSLQNALDEAWRTSAREDPVQFI